MYVGEYVRDLSFLLCPKQTNGEHIQGLLQYCTQILPMQVITVYSCKYSLELQGRDKEQSVAHNITDTMLEDDNQRFLISFYCYYSSTNMATMSLSFDSQGIDCKPSIVYINRLSTYVYNRRELQYMRNCMYMGYRLSMFHFFHYYYILMHKLLQFYYKSGTDQLFRLKCCTEVSFKLREAACALDT